jgi:hypothetical protein
VQVLKETGAQEAVTAMVDERLNAARVALAELSGLNPEGRLFLRGLIDYLWERKR